jgi:hypothetical protein
MGRINSLLLAGLVFSSACSTSIPSAPMATKAIVFGTPTSGLTGPFQSVALFSQLNGFAVSQGLRSWNAGLVAGFQYPILGGAAGIPYAVLGGVPISGGLAPAQPVMPGGPVMAPPVAPPPAPPAEPTEPTPGTGGTEPPPTGVGM